MNEVYQKICELYNRELNLLDICSENKNDETAFDKLLICKEEREQLQGTETLSHIFETVYGLANETTISLVIEEAETLQETNPGTCNSQMLLMYAHALDGCRQLYGETGEKTIECKIQIVTIFRMMMDAEESIPEGFDEAYILSLLENLFSDKHDHPIYGTYIMIMLADEYINQGKKLRALDVFAQWEKTHPIEAIGDVEIFNSWIEYANLFGELGYLTEAVSISDKLLLWLPNNLRTVEYTEIPYFYRRISDIYLSCSQYEKGINLLTTMLEQEKNYPDSCKSEFYNIRGQLAHLLNLSGDHASAATIMRELKHDLDEEGTNHPSRLNFENIEGLIENNLLDYRESFERIKRVYEETRSRRGENNTDTVLYEFNLGNAYMNLALEADLEEQEEYYRLAQEYMEDALRRTQQPPVTDPLFELEVRRGLADLMAITGQPFDAIIGMKEIYDTAKELLTDDNLQTVEIAERYGSLVLEAQQYYMDVPDWLDEIDPEPILQYGYEKKREYLGDKHGDTMQALFMYIRAIQSNEMIRTLRENKAGDFTLALQLHNRLLKNLRYEIEQAAFINSLEKQSNYLDLLDQEADVFLWLLDFLTSLELSYTLEQCYNWILPYKNVLFDLLYNQKNDAEVQEVDVTAISKRMRIEKGVFVDIWQSGNAWQVFYTDQNGTRYETISPIPDEDIPDIDDADEEGQPQLDELYYDIEERIERADYICSQLSDELQHYKKIYLNLHKQLSGFPIAAMLHNRTKLPVYCISSATELLREGKNMQVLGAVSVWGNSGSIDGIMIQQNLQTQEINCMSEMSNVVSITGHGFYKEDYSIPYDKRSYIITENGTSISNDEILQENLRQTDLVMLPICQSGAGTIYSNFGPFSAGAVFRISGAHFSVETLWDVRTTVSLVFEYEFSKYLSQGKTVSEAFWETSDCLKKYTGNQVKILCRMMQEYPEYKEIKYLLYLDSLKDTPFIHPRDWAGFVLMGD